MKRYHYTSQISEHIKETPEGYLLCLDVPIARTGILEYLPEEVNMEAAEGRSAIQVYRMDADFFTAATLASFEGKPVTIDHPDDFVTPANWAGHVKGIAQNIRRGEGEDQDLLLADLLIMDGGAIQLVRGGLREISCGYDAEYEELAPGTGKQKNIIGNHIALVQNGRCGSRCQIKDKDMKKKKAESFLDRLKTNILRRRTKDADVVGKENGEALVVLTESELEELARMPPEDVPADLVQAVTGEATTDEPGAGNGLEAKLAEILLLLRGLVDGKSTDQDPAQTGDGEEPSQTGDVDPEEKNPTATGDKKTGRSARTRTADADMVQRARLLAPNQHFSIGDNAEAVASIALRMAHKDARLAPVIDGCLSGQGGIDEASWADLNTALTAASEVARAINNRSTADSLLAAKTKDTARNKSMTPAELNRIHQEHRDSMNGGKK